jgi:hypothetical protein
MFLHTSLLTLIADFFSHASFSILLHMYTPFCLLRPLRILTHILGRRAVHFGPAWQWWGHFSNRHPNRVLVHGRPPRDFRCGQRRHQDGVSVGVEQRAHRRPFSGKYVFCT